MGIFSETKKRAGQRGAKCLWAYNDGNKKYIIFQNPNFVTKMYCFKMSNKGKMTDKSNLITCTLL